MPGSVLGSGGSVVKKTIHSLSHEPSKEWRQPLRNWVNEASVSVRNSLKKASRKLRWNERCVSHLGRGGFLGAQLPTGLLCKVTVRLRLEAGDELPLQSSSRECGLGGGQRLERVEYLHVLHFPFLLLLFNICLSVYVWPWWVCIASRAVL